MTAPEEKTTDNSSIKPVASLRSHFEGIAGSRAVSPVPVSPGSKTEVLKASLQDGRPSLDLSKKVPTLDAPDDAQVRKSHVISQGSEKTAPPVPPPRLSPRPRPMSMATFSSPAPAPAIHIQSPTSPPNPFASPKRVQTTAFGETRLSRVPQSFKEDSPESMPPKLSFDRIQGDEYVSHPPKSTPTNQKAMILGEASRDISGPVGLKIPYPPPPVNRADKPKTFPKIAASDQSNLAPESSVQWDRASPFSTPPSSDGSPVLEEKASDDFSGLRSSKSNRAGLNQPNLPLPSNGRTWEAKNKSFNESNVSRPRKADPRELGFSSHHSVLNDASEERPGLPPRPIAKQTTYEPSTIRRQSEALPQQARKTSFSPLHTSESQRLAQNFTSNSETDFLPPPRRNHTVISQPILPRRTPSLPAREPMHLPNNVSSLQHTRPAEEHHINALQRDDKVTAKPLPVPIDYPDSSQSNRRPPFVKLGLHEIETKYDTRLFDVHGRYACSSGYLTKAWDIISGEQLLSLGHIEKEMKILSLAFKPGATPEDEGLRLWLGTNYGELQEVDILSSVIIAKSNAHSSREIVKIHRHLKSMWTLDEDGRLFVWQADTSGSPNFSNTPLSHRVPKGHVFSVVARSLLWLAVGKEIRIFRPGATADESFFAVQHPLVNASNSEVTSGAYIREQPERVYFGHADGKITIYSTEDYSLIGVVNASIHKINCLAGMGSFLWAGYNTGMMYVYDTRTQPWTVKKDWRAHESSIAGIISDQSAEFKIHRSQVVSIGLDNAIRFWDGMLEQDWLENDMQEHDLEYCDFREIKAVVVTWNAGATVPPSLRYDEREADFFRDVIQIEDPPDIIVFGFQELVDLDDTRLTAKSLFKGNKKKDSSEQEHMSRQYRAWRDFLARCIEDNMPSNEGYHLLHTASMVGLFSCIFVKGHERTRVRNLNAAEVKRGLGGLHGNKGALILRFIIDDSSLCFINCHLAAGQSHTQNRNNDFTAIIESTVLPFERNAAARMDTFVSGGDGSMILDHEICILNGDLNYRIDTMGRETVVKAIKANNLAKLLERDQLLVSRRRYPGSRLTAFHELPIRFAPTYKYDVGTDEYDTSEKSRSPAWCDRLLYRGVGRVKQQDYRRHELKASDHRPVSGTFRMRVKSISQAKRIVAWQQCEARLKEVKDNFIAEARIDYLVNVLGLDVREARRIS